jgi:hypothetical protein
LVLVVRAARDRLEIMLEETTVGTLRPSALLHLAAAVAALLPMGIPLRVGPPVDREAVVEISMDQVLTEPKDKGIKVATRSATIQAAAVVVAAAAPVLPALTQ